jgi:hypothetical protein
VQGQHRDGRGSQRKKKMGRFDRSGILARVSGLNITLLLEALSTQVHRSAHLLQPPSLLFVLLIFDFETDSSLKLPPVQL